MAITRGTQSQLEKGDFEALESAWFAHMGTAPEDLDYFVGVARALVGNGSEGRARTLLELLDDELRGKSMWAARLALLRKAGHLLASEPARLHPMIMATLKQLHGGSKNFAGFLDKVGLHRATDDLPKAWEKVERLETLLQFDVGAIGWMESKGAGRVVEVNLALESFKVDFDTQKGLNVGFRAAGKLLRPLPEGHFLRRKLEEPLTLVALRDSDPSALLQAVLESFGKAMTAAEIKQALVGLVSEKEWTSWWNAARKHPQVMSNAAGRQTYAWAASGQDALAALWVTFQKVDARAKLDLLRRNAERDPALARRMATVLVEAGEQAVAQQPGLAFEIWYALERTALLPADLRWSPESLLTSNDWKRVVLGIEDRLLRERAYTMMRERRGDWPVLYSEMLWREEDPRILDLLAAGVRHHEPVLFERFVDQLVSVPRKGPAAFVWVAEKAAEDEELRARNPLRLIQQLVSALTADEMASYKVRLKALCESGSTLPRLLSHLDLEKAVLAAEAIHKAPGLELYQREALTNAIEMRFPALRQQTKQPLYATDASIVAKRAELKQLLEVDIPANRKAIEEARALGDLRENFEYKSARQRHEYLASRVASLHRDLERVAPIDRTRLTADEVRIGTVVTLDGGDHTRTITILGPWESSPETGILSYESEQGQALLGKRIGDVLALSGTAYTLTTIVVF